MKLFTHDIGDFQHLTDKKNFIFFEITNHAPASPIIEEESVSDDEPIINPEVVQNKTFSEALIHVENETRTFLTSKFKEIYGKYRYNTDNNVEITLRVNNIIEKISLIFKEKETENTMSSIDIDSYNRILNKYRTTEQKEGNTGALENKRRSIFNTADQGTPLEFSNKVNNERLKQWIDENHYTFKKGSHNNGVEIYHNDTFLTYSPRGLVEIWPIEIDGNIKGFITLDGDGDMASRFAEGAMHYMKGNNAEDNITISVGRNGDPKRAKFDNNKEAGKRRSLEAFGTQDVENIMNDITRRVTSTTEATDARTENRTIDDNTTNETRTALHQNQPSSEQLNQLTTQQLQLLETAETAENDSPSQPSDTSTPTEPTLSDESSSAPTDTDAESTPPPATPEQTTPTSVATPIPQDPPTTPEPATPAGTTRSLNTQSPNQTEETNETQEEEIILSEFLSEAYTILTEKFGENIEAYQNRLIFFNQNIEYLQQKELKSILDENCDNCVLPHQIYALQGVVVEDDIWRPIFNTQRLLDYNQTDELEFTYDFPTSGFYVAINGEQCLIEQKTDGNWYYGHEQVSGCDTEKLLINAEDMENTSPESDENTSPTEENNNPEPAPTKTAQSTIEEFAAVLGRQSLEGREDNGRSTSRKRKSKKSKKQGGHRKEDRWK